VICKIKHEEVTSMSVQQEVIPRLPTLISNFMIISLKRIISFISRGKGAGEKQGEIKHE
jgi:hypothetical protein